MNLRKISKLLSTATLAACALLVSLSATAQIELLDKVIAIVDDDVVLQSELNQRVATVYAQIQQSGTQAPPQDILLQQVLERLISERLQLNIAYSAGVRIPDEELNAAMGRIAAGNQLTMEQYVEQVHSQGQTIAAVREEIRNELTLMRVQQGKVMRRIRISQQELDNFLNSEEGRFLTSTDVNIGQILLSVPSSASTAEADKVLAKAKDLQAQISSGVDFRQLAIAN